MTELNLREHCLVDVEGLINDLNLFSGLLLIPLLELIDEFFIDVVGPVIDLENPAAFISASQQQQSRYGKE